MMVSTIETMKNGQRSLYHGVVQHNPFADVLDSFLFLKVQYVCDIVVCSRKLSYLQPGMY